MTTLAILGLALLAFILGVWVGHNVTARRYRERLDRLRRVNERR